MKKIYISIVASKHLSMLASEAIKETHDDMLEINIIHTTMENFYTTLNGCNIDNIDVFISGGVYAQLLQQSFNKPVVTIRKTSMDFLLAMLEAKKDGKNIVVTSFKDEPLIDFEEIERISGVNLSTIIFSDIEELREIFKQSKYDSVVGSSLSTEIAAEYGIKNHLVYNGKNSVIDAILNAKHLYLSINERNKKNSFYESMLNFNTNGLIVTDQLGFISDINPAAEIILNTIAEKMIGKNIMTVFSGVNFDPLLSMKKTQLEDFCEYSQKKCKISAISVEQATETIGFMITVTHISSSDTQRNNIDKAVNLKAKSTFSDIMGSSYILQDWINKSKKYARTDANILIMGETGVGKELFAQSIHNYSYRYKNPFVAVNCAAIPASILESELFGYEEGAFTGSKKGGKKGLFEISNYGTIFLDEIGEIPFELQTRLLRVIQEKEIMRLGGDRTIPINVRIICATNKDLDSMVPDKFREDLFYRISVLQLTLPPLRQRGDDIIELFLLLLGKHHSIGADKLSKERDYLQVLKKYSWPGNIREMQNVITRFSMEIVGSHDFNKKVINKLLIDAIGEKRLINDICIRNGILDVNNVNPKDINVKLLNELMETFPRQHEKISAALGIGRTTLWRILNKNETSEKIVE